MLRDRRLLRLFRAAHSRWLRPLVTVLGIIAILHWRTTEFDSPAIIAKVSDAKITFSHGIAADWQFVFFLKNLGLFPLAPPVSSIRHDPIRHRDVVAVERDTPEEARRLIRTNAAGLRMDEGLTWRSGGFGRVYLYLYDLWKNPAHFDAPSVRPANQKAFDLSLVLLWLAFCSVWRPWMGGALVLLLGSNPLQIYSIYGEDNVFSWNITTMIALLALHVPLIFSSAGVSDCGVPVRRLLWIPLASTLLLGLVRTVRSEPAALMASLLLVYATLSGVSWRERAKFIAALLISAALINKGTHAFFEAKIARTREVVRAAGGTPFPARKPLDHELWHPIWCGLKDFDTTYNREFEDRAAFRAALPELERRAGRPLGLDPNAWEQPNYPLEPTRRYLLVFGEYPGYDAAIRTVLLDQMRRTPRWYPTILAKRVERIITRTTPLTVIIRGEHHDYDSPLLGTFAICVMIFSIVVRRGRYALLILFSAPLSATALIISSDGGLTNYTLFHVFGVVCAAALCFEGTRMIARAALGRAARREEPASLQPSA